MFNWLGAKTEPGVVGVGLHSDGVSLICVQRGRDGSVFIPFWEFRPWCDGEALDDLITRLADEHKLSARSCATFLDPSDYRVMLADTPEVPDAELNEAMRWRVKDLVDFDVTQAVVETFSFPGGSGNQERQQRYVVVAEQQALQRRIRLLEQAGVNLDVVDVPELAIRNLAERAAGDVATALLYLNDNYGLLTLTHGTTLYMSRSINIGTANLLNVQDRRPLLDNILAEIQRSLDYFSSHFRHDTIEQLLLAPMPAHLPGMDEYFGDRLGVKVRAIRLAELAQWHQPIIGDVEPRCAMTLGVALRQVH